MFCFQIVCLKYASELPAASEHVARGERSGDGESRRRGGAALAVTEPRSAAAGSVRSPGSGAAGRARRAEDAFPSGMSGRSPLLVA